MDEGLISARYATALFSLAKEKNQLLTIKEDMELILAVCNQSADFNRLLSSPVIKPSEKIAAIRSIFSKKLSTLSVNFLELTVRNNRETFVTSFCRKVLAFIREENNIKTAVITTAKPIDEATFRNAEKTLEKELGAHVELTRKTDPSLIGGLVLRIDDRQYDATILTRLKKLKQELLKAQM